MSDKESQSMVCQAMMQMPCADSVEISLLISALSSGSEGTLTMTRWSQALSVDVVEDKLVKVPLYMAGCATCLRGMTPGSRR